MTMAAEGNRPLLPPTDAALDTDEAVHAALEGVCSCGACTAWKLGTDLPPPEIQQSVASQNRSYGKQRDSDIIFHLETMTTYAL
ncbi:MAG: hypothetical protein MK107_05650 [Oceanicola sp.]|nr:hypothetical protein [Oceanicola sp.]